MASRWRDKEHQQSHETKKTIKVESPALRLYPQGKLLRNQRDTKYGKTKQEPTTKTLFYVHYLWQACITKCMLFWSLNGRFNARIQRGGVGGDMGSRPPGKSQNYRAP